MQAERSGLARFARLAAIPCDLDCAWRKMLRLIASTTSQGRAACPTDEGPLFFFSSLLDLIWINGIISRLFLLSLPSPPPRLILPLLLLPPLYSFSSFFLFRTVSADIYIVETSARFKFKPMSMFPA